jgi:hypothetical protein
MLRKIVVLAILITISLFQIDRALALPPLSSLIPLTRVEADPDKTYEVSTENGPWMILAATFAGENAERDAKNLVLELRKNFKLEAFSYKKHYDFAQTGMPGLGVTPTGDPVRMNYMNPKRFDEIAVMVGDYPSVNDARLQNALKTLKYAWPKTLAPNGRPIESQRYAGLRELQRLVTGDPEKKKMGPMRRAIATRNPLAPQNQGGQGSLEQFVVDMNRDVKHSLLDCPSRYTVRVATFSGNVVIDQKEVQKLQKGGTMKSRLERAAINAHRLTEALRAQGVEAYEFHDRHESIVTVGSFDSLGQYQIDGSFKVTPGIVTISNAYGIGAEHDFQGDADHKLAKDRMAGLRPKTLDGIPFDTQPVAMEVPRKSIGSDYASRQFPW